MDRAKRPRTDEQHRDTNVMVKDSLILEAVINNIPLSSFGGETEAITQRFLQLLYHNGADEGLPVAELTKGTPFCVRNAPINAQEDETLRSWSDSGNGGALEDLLKDRTTRSVFHYSRTVAELEARETSASRVQLRATQASEWPPGAVARIRGAGE
jgi:hypothetical protein